MKISPFYLQVLSTVIFYFFRQTRNGRNSVSEVKSLKLQIYICNRNTTSWADPKGGGTGGPDPPGKSQVALGYLRNSGMGTPREVIRPNGPL